MNEENNFQEEAIDLFPHIGPDIFQDAWNDTQLHQNNSPGSDEKSYLNEADQLNYHVSNPQAQTQVVDPHVPILGDTSFGQSSIIPAGVLTGVPTGVSAGVSGLYPMHLETPALQFPEVSTGSPEVAPVASLPAANNWKGNCGFDVYFERTEECTNSSSWTYSHHIDKLYVKKDTPCPIKFVTTDHVPYGSSIRAMIVFAKAQCVSEVVQRCFNHTEKDLSSGAPLASLAHHVLRCESLGGVYEQHPISKQHSVVVDYEGPQRGATESTYVYSFACWGSCAGGINRRPIKIVFTLEYGGLILGRRALDLRICACPGRDRLNDEKVFRVSDNKKPEPPKSGKKRKQPIKSEEDHMASIFRYIQGSPSKKAKCSSHPPGPYTITATDYRMYSFLRQMRKFYFLCRALENFAPLINQFLIESRARAESSGEDRKTSDESD